MSIRLRLTLLYTAILALTLVIFGTALYTIQSRYTLDALKRDLRGSGNNIAGLVLWGYTHPTAPRPEANRPPPVTFENFSTAPDFQRLREREIVRVLDSNGQLIASPFGSNEDALPLNASGLQELQAQRDWWEISSSADGRLLIYNHPVISNAEVVSIVQVARSLAEHDRSLASLGATLIIASLLTMLIAFGIGWVLSGAALRPIHRITQTARAIGSESDFTRRVDYTGPNDEIGQLATTFNSMLARLQDAYQRVSAALNLQREFVADVSHELRTPITTVRGNLALLLRKPPLPPEEQADILTDVVEESDRLIRLVNDLLVLARADAGQSLECHTIAILPVIEEVCRQANPIETARAIKISVPELNVLADRDALKQVLLITVDNAVKYSRGDIQITAEAVQGSVVIGVQDDGPGIAPETLEHIFERFYRGESSSAVPGFGLGLPIAKSLLESQGGSISIDSQEGQGSRVKITLPMA